MPVRPETVERLTAGLAQLLRTGRHISSRAAAQLYGDLPSFGWALLVPLERDGDRRVSALADRAGVDVSVASRQLAVLERGGLVERRADPDDGRATLFRLTEAGHQALAATRVLRSRWATGALAGWSDADARRLAELLDRLTDDLEAALVPPSPHPAAALAG